MKKTFSLKESKEFQKAINRGTWYGGELISIYIMPNKQNFNFLGLAIGKKVGKAVKRNRVKRVIRAAYLEMEENIKNGFNIIFVWRAKAKFEDLTYKCIKRDVERAFKKMDLIKCNKRESDNNG